MTHGEKIKYRDLVRAVEAYARHLEAHPDSIYMDNATLIERQTLWVNVRIALTMLAPV